MQCWCFGGWQMDLNFVDLRYFFWTQILIFRYFLFQSLSLVCSPKYLLLALKVSPVLNFFPLSVFASQSGGKFVRTGGKVTTIIFLFFLLWKPEVLLEYSNKLFLQCFVCLIGCGEEWKESLLVAGEWQRQDNSPSMASQWLLVLVPVVLVASAWDSLSQRLLTMQLGNNLPYILTLQYYLILFVPKP